jgi:hypothetical protein
MPSHEGGAFTRRGESSARAMRVRISEHVYSAQHTPFATSATFTSVDAKPEGEVAECVCLCVCVCVCVHVCVCVY